MRKTMSVREFKEFFLNHMDDEDFIIIYNADKVNNPEPYKFFPTIKQYSDEDKTKELVINIVTE